MNNYAGKICPFCKTEIKPDDEVVVCSECDMPHHKDCWIENQGCSTFGCLGTIKSSDNIATATPTQQINNSESSNSSAVTFCTACGAVNDISNSFCSKCGNRLTTAAPVAQSHAYTQTYTQNTGSYTYADTRRQGPDIFEYNSSAKYVDSDDTLFQLIGKKAEYYTRKFNEMTSLNKKVSWNWAAFLFSPYWMFYRKMYSYGAGLIALSFFISLIYIAVPSATIVLLLISFAVQLVIGFSGNRIYMKFIENKMTRIKSMNEPFKTQFVIHDGGVNTVAAVLTAVAYSALMIIIQKIIA